MTNITTDTKSQKKNQDDLLAETEEMYKKGVHFGYSRSLTHPKIQPYLYVTRNNIQIFDLEKTYFCLEKARDFLEDLGERQVKVLIVATRPEFKEIVDKIVDELGAPCITERWLGGTLTNFDIIKKRIEGFADLIREKESGKFAGHSKKEIVRINKQILKLEKQLGGIKTLSELPAALVVVDSKKEEAAIKEARQKKIPIIAILNTDCDPSLVDYPIPANDSSFSSVEYLLGKLAAAYKKGKTNKKLDKDNKKKI